MKLLTYRETSEILNIPISTLYSRVSEKTIPHVRIGPRMVRFLQSDILDLIQKSIVKAKDKGVKK